MGEGEAWGEAVGEDAPRPLEVLLLATLPSTALPLCGAVMGQGMT